MPLLRGAPHQQTAPVTQRPCSQAPPSTAGTKEHKKRRENSFPQLLAVSARSQPYQREARLVAVTAGHGSRRLS